MSNCRASQALILTMGLVGLFGMLQYARSISSVRHWQRSGHGDHGVERQTPQLSDISQSPPWYRTKVPGEVDGFTPHIWQTTGSRPLTTDQLVDVSSWREKHPFFALTLMTDEQGDNFVREHWAHKPNILDLYLRFPIPIIKADLFRYMVLVTKGGIYADIDVFCDRPISLWLPPDQLNNTDSINLIVGLEFDLAFRGEGVEIASQFTNWVLASKPGNKHLQHVIDSAVTSIYTVAEENKVDIEGLELWMFSDVINVAGPKQMTIAIFESLSRDMDKVVDDRMTSGIMEPRLVGDVLIMPNNAFAAFQAGYPKDQGPVMVTHHYAGSWKPEADAAKEHRKIMKEQA